MKAKKTSNNCVVIFCPACDEHHAIAVGDPHEHPRRREFNNDFEKPSFSPSLKVSWGYCVEPIKEEERNYYKEQGWGGICHSVITDGRIAYCGDCTHPFAGQTLDLPDLIRD